MKDQYAQVVTPPSCYNIFERLSFKWYQKLPRWEQHYPNAMFMSNVGRDFRSIAWHSNYRTVYPHTMSFRMLRAITMNDVLQVKKILDCKHFDVNNHIIDKKYNMNSLMYATVINRHNIIELLLLHGANINKADELGNTPLMLAVSHQNLEAINTLMKHGCNRHLKNKFAFTPITKAEDNFYSPHIAKFIRQYPHTPRKFPYFKVKLTLPIKHPMWQFIQNYRIYDNRAKIYPFNDFKGLYRIDFGSYKTVKEILQLQENQLSPPSKK